MNTVFGVLAEPRRRQILDLVRDRERSVGELVAEMSASQPAVSKHLRVLREAGLVQVRVSEQRRMYRLSPGPLRDLDAWLTPYREMWAASLDRLEHRRSQMTGEQACPDGQQVRPHGQETGPDRHEAAPDGEEGGPGR
jgi:DNA-binding transcriptional ArsR family regulator